MMRLHIVVEGNTEWAFVKNVLAPHLADLNVFTDARRVATRRDKRRNYTYRGGMTLFEHLKDDLLRWIKEDDHPGVYFTTLVDLYRIPDSFPAYGKACNSRDPYQKVNILEQGMEEYINFYRFIPYIQLHEFEALLFVDPGQLQFYFLEHKRAIKRLIEIASRYENPEWINDGDRTAPSKQLITHIPEYDYQKAVVGPLVAERIGIPRLRAACPHFDTWITRLEALGGEPEQDEQCNTRHEVLSPDNKAF